MTIQFSEACRISRTMNDEINKGWNKMMKRGRKSAAEKKAESEKLNVGDVVELKCGSPGMVVIHVHDVGGDVSCAYYEGRIERGFSTQYFPSAALHKRTLNFAPSEMTIDKSLLLKRRK